MAAGILKTLFRRNEKKIEFSEGLLRTLCYDTDIGPIPRGIDLDISMFKPNYMDSTNWNFPIQGCYWCSDTKKDFLEICCSKECLFYFHDWCIGRVALLTQRTFCRFPGCDRACVNSSFCDTTHKNEFGKAFPQWVDQASLSRSVLRNGPSWYNSKSLDDQPTTNLSINSDIKIKVFKFSDKLSTNLSQYTDVGLIPRWSGQQNHTFDQFPPTNPCSNVDIVGCYWCGNSNTCFEEMACCVRCWLLLHEWCVRRVEQVCRLKLCGLPGCEEPRVDPYECCSFEHVKERSFLIGGVSIRLQEEIELTLGPKWYSDLTPICFSESGPFSELSNSFPSLLNLYRMIWPTVHHCMYAQKLLGTPYLHHVRKMERLHELEEWEVRCVKWVRPDWEGVRKRVLYQALMAKFQQNCVLKGLLLRTGSRPLVCSDNAHLGDVLMSVREVLKAATFFPSINSSFGECENNSSSNSLTKVNLNEPFGVLQPNESKAYTPTLTPSYFGNVKPKDANAGIGSQFESNLSPASTDVSHHGTSNDVIIGSNTSPKSDVLSHHTINSPSQINQPSPTNFTVEKSSNPQSTPNSSQLTDVSANQSDSFDANIVQYADLTSSDIPEADK